MTPPPSDIVPELVWDLGAKLGEGPAWDVARGVVWSVDIKGRRLHAYGHADDRRQSWEAPDQIGFALPAADGSLICGVRGGLHRFEPGTGRFTLVQPVEAERPANRLNDGFVSPDGALWFGSMHDDEVERCGALYRYSGGVLTRMDDGYGVTNGPAMSPDGRTLYHHDTLEKVIYAFDHTDGRLSRKRRFAVTEEGYPDGPSVDAAGVLHVGLFNGWGVGRWAPDGTALPVLPLPVPAVTKAAFCGPDLRTLYCTTAWLGMDATRRADHPLAGGLFRLRVDTPGLPPTPFRGWS